ncbi:helix-turn-helix domain-containing protein [Pseudonocardia sp. TRM90224]|uniref:helix-turn-helix domain-containing protein n=1 Tax=Pseudonocardia sp. TRM90224 TaxID=2812678 RepID=UPI001E417CC9|nr:XRE family transcriptional regulator [Pseudonocardia sp. TRM90224]
MPEQPSTAFTALADPTDVGARVGQLRSERGLSLSELARRAGVGKATVSGIEAGTRNPTLDTLQRISTALQVPITAVVGTGGPVSVLQTPGPLLRGTAVLVETLRAWTEPGVTYELFRLHVPAGRSQTSPAHHPGVTECVVVFAGELVAGPLDHPVHVPAGGFAEWPADVRHGYAAVGDVDVQATLLIRSPDLR